MTLGEVHRHHAAEGVSDDDAARRDLAGHIVDERVEVWLGRQVQGGGGQVVRQGANDRGPGLRVAVEAGEKDEIRHAPTLRGAAAIDAASVEGRADRLRRSAAGSETATARRS
ncbi:hypothetical protein GCM10009570_10250 [Dietzia natronolimnaea]